MHTLVRHEGSILVCVLLFAVFSAVRSDNENITISLNKTITPFNREIYGDFITIKENSTLQVNLEANYKKNVSFIIFQVHSHMDSITLYKNTFTRGSHINGTNVGLYSPVQPALDTYYIVNDNAKDLRVFITIHGYRKKDPIPGGCNLDLPVEVSPFMQLSYSQHIINIAAAAPKSADSVCGIGDTELTFYKMFLPERMFDEETYFKGLRKMSTLESILENGDEIPAQHLPKKNLRNVRRSLGTYVGTGSVYVVVASMVKDPSVYSVYVPSYTYACKPENGDCNIMDDFLSQTFCAAMLFIGLFTCYFGHRFFKTEMFLVGMFAGVVVSYILVSINSTNVSQAVLLGASLLSGVFFGAIWLLFWWFYGIPIMAVFLSTLHLGFMLASVIYFGVPPGHELFEQDSTFWTIFILIMVLTSLTLLTTTFLSNILSCAVIGAYAAVFAIDQYMGSNLKYIVINSVRRAVVTDFNYVDMSPPYQWRDGITTLFWVLLSISGFLFQHYHNRGRPPFPPPPRSITPRPPYSSSGYGSIGGMSGVVGRTRRLFTIERGTDIASERAPLLASEDPSRMTI